MTDRGQRSLPRRQTVGPTAVVATQNIECADFRRPIAVDLFSGAGGLSLGFEQAGFDILAAVEIEEVHADVHRYNFPRTEVIAESACTLRIERLRQAITSSHTRHERGVWDGNVDVVFGGPPCQGFSAGGTRQSDDPRNLLLFQFIRIVRELKPKYFVMENVPGLMQEDYSALIAEFREEVRNAGYVIPDKFPIVNAADFGVPQERARVIVIGTRVGQPIAGVPQAYFRRPGKLKNGRHRDGDSQATPLLPLSPTVADALRGLPIIENFKTLLESDVLVLPPRRGRPSVPSPYVLALNGADPQDFSYPRDWKPNRVTNSGRTAHSKETVKRFAKTLPGKTDRISRYRRLELRGLCKTLRAGTGKDHGSHTPPRPIHPVLPRVITVREAARLHSFPDWFSFHTTKWHAWRQLGNSVPPRLGRVIASEIVRTLSLTPTKPNKTIPLGLPALLGSASDSVKI